MEPELLLLLVENGGILLLHTHRNALLRLSQFAADVSDFLTCNGVLVLQGILKHCDFIFLRTQLPLRQLLHLPLLNLVLVASIFEVLDCPIPLGLCHLYVLLKLLHQREESLDLCQMLPRLGRVRELLIRQE